MASSSSSSFSPRWIHDVFLSFRGEDTRNNFTTHLFKALEQAGIYTFRDDERLRVGEEISPTLMKAIEESKISLIVFSKDYASSRWCLDELVQIIECKNQLKGYVVYPVFYNVEPSQVRKQTGSFAEAFARHKGAFKREKLQKWREALTAAANIVGSDSQRIANGDESELIQTIVREISSTLSDVSLNVAEHPIGMDSRIKEMNRLLGIGTNDVRIVGIWGMGGIGKTTIAKEVFNQISGQFDGSCFLTNVREVSMEPSGLVRLQEQLLSAVLKGINIKLNNVDKGMTLIRERLRYKKVLIVLDDVDHREQLVKLAGDRDWFGSGSRVIITTRDEGLLIERKVDEIYKAMELNPNEALQLFCLHCFRENLPPENIYLEISKRAIEYANGLPLALKVLGSFLSSKSDCDEWKDALDELERNPNIEIQKVLRISFDGLSKNEKNIFLDIACFFKERDKYSVTKILESCDFFPHAGIRVLIRKSLITIIDDKLWMHDLLQEMGREIIREESPREPGKRSRVWSPEDAYHVLTKKTGTEVVEGIIVDLSRFGDKQFSTEAFLRMSKLRFLKVYYSQLSRGSSYGPDELYALLEDCKVDISADCEFLSNELRCLIWQGYPSKSLPSRFLPEYLVELDMCYSRIDQLWKGTKKLGTLKFIKLSHSQYLIKTPDYSGVPNLERLELEGCTILREFHPSIGVLKRLVSLNLRACKNLKSLPDSICKLKSLEILTIADCSQLDKLPENLGDLECLSELDASETAIKYVPLSIVRLKNLKRLYFGGCKGAPSNSCPLSSCCLLPREDPDSMGLILPASFSGLCSLQVLNFEDCNLMEGALPSDLGCLSSLKDLYLRGNNFVSLPASITRLSRLETLQLDNCNLMEGALPSDLGCLSSLKVLILGGNNFVTLPASITHLSRLETLTLDNCNLMEGALPGDLGCLSSLEYLNLGGNNFVSLPTSITRLSLLEFLELDNCNLMEGALPSDLGCLSSLKILNLVGNNFVSLPASITRLSRLEVLQLDYCKRLQALPELPSSLCYIFANGCTSLETLPSPWVAPNLRKLNFANCFKLVETNHINSIIFMVLARLLPDDFNCILPGREIPEWFRDQNMGSSMSIQLPPHCYNSKFMGLVMCAILPPQHLTHWVCGFQIKFNDEVWDSTSGAEGMERTPIESDHVYLAGRTIDSQPNHWSQLEVFFTYETYFLKVNKCGVRLVYEQDVEELI